MEKKDIKNRLRGSQLFEPYNRDACEVCGACLSECPVMRLPESEAKREMAALREGRPGRHVLSRCETCFACNLACPNNANPAMLFLDRFHEEHLSAGMPEWSAYFQPHEPGNFRSRVAGKMPVADKQLLEKWADTSPCGEFTYPGCNICATPALTRMKFLDGLNIRGGLDYCCGEMYFRTGQFDQLRQTAARLNRYFEKLGARRMMVLCTAGYNIFTNILPRFGLKTDMEITSYLPWLWERIDGGDIKITKPLGMTVTVQDSCHAKTIGPEYEELPRKIMERIGVKVKEMRHNRDCAYCCGIGGGFPAKKNYNPISMTMSTLRAVIEADRAGADAVLAYCAGCLQSLSTGAVVYPRRLPIYHIFELVGMAAGETVEPVGPGIGKQFLLGILKNQVPKLLSSKKITPPEIPVEP